MPVFLMRQASKSVWVSSYLAPQASAIDQYPQGYSSQVPVSPFGSKQFVRSPQKLTKNIDDINEVDSSPATFLVESFPQILCPVATTLTSNSTVTSTIESMCYKYFTVNLPTPSAFCRLLNLNSMLELTLQSHDTPDLELYALLVENDSDEIRVGKANYTEKCIENVFNHGEDSHSYIKRLQLVRCGSYQIAIFNPHLYDDPKSFSLSVKILVPSAIEFVTDLSEQKTFGGEWKEDTVYQSFKIIPPRISSLMQKLKIFPEITIALQSIEPLDIYISENSTYPMATTSIVTQQTSSLSKTISLQTQNPIYVGLLRHNYFSHNVLSFTLSTSVIHPIVEEKITPLQSAVPLHVTFQPHEGYKFFHIYVPAPSYFAKSLNFDSSLRLQLEFNQENELEFVFFCSQSTKFPHSENCTQSFVYRPLHDSNNQNTFFLEKSGDWYIALHNSKYLQHTRSLQFCLNSALIIPSISDEVVPIYLNIPVKGTLSPKVPYHFLVTAVFNKQRMVVTLESKDATLLVRKNVPYALIDLHDYRVDNGTLKSVTLAGGITYYISVFDPHFRTREKQESFSLLLSEEKSVNPTNTAAIDFVPQYPQIQTVSFHHCSVNDRETED